MIATENNPGRSTDAAEPADSATPTERPSREKDESKRRERSFSLRALLPGPYVRYPE